MLRNRVPMTSGLDVGTDPSRKPKSLVDAVLFGLFVYDGFPVPGVPGNIPGSDAAAVVLVGLAAFRRPGRTLGTAAWFVPFWALLLIYLMFASMYNDVDWFRRAFRIAMMAALVVAIVTERVDLRSGLQGLGIALLANLLLFYAGVAPDKYGGFLTGYLGDKNVAGLYYTVVPLMLIAMMEKRRHQILCILVGALAVFLTGSRTSLAAYAGAMIWMVLPRRLGSVSRIVMLALLASGLQYLETNFARAGMFSERLGSDLLRERIGEAAAAKAAEAPWYGLGLGEAYVNVDLRRWFFHDSYLALYVEGGWILLFTVVVIYIFVGFGSFSSKPPTRKLRSIEATTVAILICASKLGEVFLSLPGFVLLAYGLVARILSGPVVQFIPRKPEQRPRPLLKGR